MRTTKITLGKLRLTTLTAFLLLITSQGFSEILQNDDDCYPKKVNFNLAAFIENAGQHPRECLYYIRTSPSTTALLMKTGEIVYSTNGSGNSSGITNQIVEKLSGLNNIEIIPISNEDNYRNEFHIVDGKVVTYKARKYNSILYRNILDGVSMDLVTRGSTIERRFFIEPHANVDKISIATESSSLEIDESGNLIIKNNDHLISYSNPIAYQEYNNVRQLIDINYSISGSNYGFEVGDYDHSRELIIDPLLGSSYLALGDANTGPVVIRAMDIDNQGNVYMVGEAGVPEYPQTLTNVIMLKMNNDLTQLLYEAYIIGSGHDYGRDIKVCPNGEFYIAGTTESTDFPTTANAFDRTHNGMSDFYVSKIRSDFDELLYSTFVGGDSIDGQQSTKIDMTSNNEIYLTGTVKSINMPIVGTPYQSVQQGIEDVYIAKLNSDLSSIITSTYLGGTWTEDPFGILQGNNGDIYITGSTWSYNFPHTQGAHTQSGTDVFITQMDGSLSQLKNSLLLGGTASGQNWEYGLDICQNSLGDIIITGGTQSLDFYPISNNAFQPNHGGTGTDMFVTRFDQNLNIITSTFFGGAGEEGSGAYGACAVNSSNDIYIAGFTYSPEYDGFPMVPGTFDGTYNGTGDAFTAMLTSGLNSLISSTYYGGNQVDRATDLVIDNNGNVIICGFTQSADLPMTQQGFYTVYTGPTDGFVAKFDPYLSQGYVDIEENVLQDYVLDIYPNPAQTETNISFTLTNHSNVEMKVIDLQGRLICTLVNSYIPEGNYEYNFLFSDFNIEAGQIYIVSIIVENELGKNSQYKKLICLE